MGASARRVLLVGIDSASLDFVRTHVARLPALRRILDTFFVRELDSPAGVLSASVWPTFYSASPPGEHGQYYPMQWDAARMRLRRVAPDWTPIEAFWRPLARNGLAVTTLDVQTLPASPTRDGLEVVNWGSQSFERFHCNQPDVGREIVRRFGRHPMGPDVPVDKRPGRLAATRRNLIAGAQRRGELARWLLEREPWQLAVIVFPECHRAGHYFWPRPDDPGAEAALADVYRAVDAEIATLLGACASEDTTVVVFSLHGMGPNGSQMHFVPPLMDRINAAFAIDEGLPAPPSPGLLRRLRERLPGPLQEAVALAVPESARDWVTSRAFAAGRDWQATPGFALPSGGEGFVRLNVVGREARGCLARGTPRARRYVDLVCETFRELCLPGTRDRIADVVLAGEHFPGPRSDALPDLAVCWRTRAPATEIESPRFGTLRGRLATGRGGNHVACAFAAVGGAARDAAPVQAMRHIVDLADVVRELARATIR
jgi:predicted AlkP superfamily phosphohydrolase/phosphomutase